MSFARHAVECMHIERRCTYAGSQAVVGSEFVVEGVKEPLCIRLCCLSKRHVRQSGRRLSGCLPVSPRASLDALLTCQRRRPFEAKVALARACASYLFLHCVSARRRPPGKPPNTLAKHRTGAVSRRSLLLEPEVQSCMVRRHGAAHLYGRLMLCAVVFVSLPACKEQLALYRAYAALTTRNNICSPAGRACSR